MSKKYNVQMFRIQSKNYSIYKEVGKCDPTLKREENRWIQTLTWSRCWNDQRKSLKQLL